jgi:hypothetical protein
MNNKDLIEGMLTFGIRAMRSGIGAMRSRYLKPILS